MPKRPPSNTIHLHVFYKKNIPSPSRSLHSTHKHFIFTCDFFFFLFVWQENSKRWIELYNRYIPIYIYIYIYKHQIVNKEIKYKRVTKCIWPLLLDPPNISSLDILFSLSTPRYSPSTSFWNNNLFLFCIASGLFFKKYIYFYKIIYIYLKN